VRIAIVGASKEAILLAKRLHELGHEIIALDDKRDRIDEIRSQLDIATFIGDLRTLNVYDESRIHRADIIIAAHEDEAMNIIACAYAKFKGVPRIIAVTTTTETANLLKSIGLTDQVVTREEILSRAILDALIDIRSLEVSKDLNIAVIDVEKHRSLLNQKVEYLEENGLKVLAIVDENGNLEPCPPKERVLKHGHRVIVVGRLRNISRALGVGI